jgi:hypothetical protein
MATYSLIFTVFYLPVSASVEKTCHMLQTKIRGNSVHYVK